MGGLRSSERGNPLVSIDQIADNALMSIDG
jgi:hypothetical protein